MQQPPPFSSVWHVVPSSAAEIGSVWGSSSSTHTKNYYLYLLLFGEGDGNTFRKGFNPFLCKHCQSNAQSLSLCHLCTLLGHCYKAHMSDGPSWPQQSHLNSGELGEQQTDGPSRWGVPSSSGHLLPLRCRLNESKRSMWTSKHHKSKTCRKTWESSDISMG